MINDLEVADIDLLKYVDDTTISKTVLKHEANTIQSQVDEFKEISVKRREMQKASNYLCKTRAYVYTRVC
jgi:flagellar basal body rod protein FlgF